MWSVGPEEEEIVEETGEEVVLMKNELGRVIGFERLPGSVSYGWR